MKILRIFLLITLFAQSCPIESRMEHPFSSLSPNEILAKRLIQTLLIEPFLRTRLSQRFIPSVSKFVSSLRFLFPKTRRETGFFLLGTATVGITFIALLPKLLRTIRENFKMPWAILEKAWNDAYQEKIDILHTFFYKGRQINANIVHLFPKEGAPEGSNETYREKIQRTKFDPTASLQPNTAILFLPGLGDIWQLMVSAQHQELFPTDEFYVAQFPDSQAQRTLQTTVGGVDEALIALLCLRYLTNQKNENGGDKYNRIIIFSESRGSAVLDLMQAFLDNWQKTKSKSFFDQKPDDDPLITYEPRLQYDYAQILEKANIQLDEKEVNTMQQKLDEGGFVYLSPLESYSGVAKLIASALPTSVLQKMGGYVLNRWAAPNLTYYDPKEQKNPMNVRRDWYENKTRRVFNSPTINDDILRNATNEIAKGRLEEKVTVFYKPHEGIHIKMQDPEAQKALWNFMINQNPFAVD
jgi:hypothetical protein